MMRDDPARPLLVETTEGVLRGAWDDGVAVFKGVPYAAPFIKTGDSNHDGTPAWPAYDERRRASMRFDSVIEPVGDLAGIGWRRAPA
jgi:carboxylesterase type B